MTYKQTTAVRAFAIAFAFLGLAFVGGGMGGVTSGDPSGWFGVAVGTLMWVYAGVVFALWCEESE